MLTLLRERRSIRGYTDQAVPEEFVDSLIQAGLYAASSRGFRPWEIVVVDDPAVIGDLSRAKAHGSAFLAGAPLALVVLGIPSESDVWVEDTAILSSNLLLEAADLGLGACWIQIRNRTAEDGSSSEAVIRELLSIPEDRRVESIIAVGYPAEEKPGYTASDLRYDKVHRGKYQG